MKWLIEQKIITSGLGLAWLMLSGVSVVSYWSLTGLYPAATLPNPMLMVAIGNSFSLVVLGWVYYLLGRAILWGAIPVGIDSFLNNCPAAIYLKDIQGTYLMSNQQLEQLVGLSKEQIVGKTDYDIFPQEIAEQFRASDRAVLQAGQCLEQEEVFHLNQVTYTFVASKCPLYDPTGTVYAVCGVSTNITERKRVERERDRFFNLSLDMLVIGNYDGYFTHLNPAWERILGFTLEELKAQPFSEFVHPEDVAATQAEMEKLKAGLPLSSFENRYRCKDGSYKWLSWAAVPFLEEKLIYAVARDVSDVCNELCLRKQKRCS